MVLTFGKHKGKPLELVLLSDHNYGYWAYLNVSAIQVHIKKAYPTLAIVYNKIYKAIENERRMWAEMLPSRNMGVKQWMQEMYLTVLSADEKGNIEKEIELIKRHSLTPRLADGQESRSQSGR